jgi:hypothetical protein
LTELIFNLMITIALCVKCCKQFVFVSLEFGCKNELELNDLVRDLGPPKDCPEILGSRHQSKNLLSPCTSFSWCRNRDKEFIPYFAHDGSLVYCSNISGIIWKLGVVYDASEWRLFMDSSKRSFEGVLLHNGNKYVNGTAEPGVNTGNRSNGKAESA